MSEKCSLVIEKKVLVSILLLYIKLAYCTKFFQEKKKKHIVQSDSVTGNKKVINS